ncbi:glycoside hydrolase family 32 protein [Enterococcus sp. AZ126]|uniref:glycoside hydrolase family 32 protein n=1 Tax=Enterococcus sp. AZ126 TaxID=2774635 RepID=UPI003F29EE28
MNKKVEKYTYYTAEWQGHLSELEEKIKKSNYLPKYHLYPKTGLMNDPNGLSYFNGKYHVFYQWFPFDSFHGMKHWGHATSEDLVKFKDEGFALIPNEEYEKNGSYSGNALEYNDELYLFYTANYKTDTSKLAKQALAIMDKKGTITKYQKNPIITGAPEGFSQELRDPFVFERNGSFYMLLGGGRFLDTERSGFGDIGELLLYKSANLFDWTYQGTIDLPIEKGYMLECPSLVTIDGKDVLFLSPMGYEKERYRYQNRFASIYLVGQLDVETRTFVMDHMDELDAGFDYYAPQSFYGKNQLPLTFGWFGCGEQVYPIDDEGWKHGLTTAQEMRLVDGKLVRFPSQELQEYFTEKQTIKAEKLTLEQPYYHLQFELNKGQDSTICFGTNDDFWQLNLDEKKQTVTIDRGHLTKKIDHDYGMKRTCEIAELANNIIVDLFVDNSFIEVYLNKGERVFSFRVFLKSEQTTISFSKETEITWAYFE